MEDSVILTSEDRKEAEGKKEKEIPEEIRAFFNPEATIQKTPEGDYKVETVLTNGVAEGGQKVVMIVVEDTPPTEKSNTLPILKKEFGWKIKHRVEKMSVNGYDFLKPNKKLYLITKPTDINENSENKRKIPDSYGTQVAITEKGSDLTFIASDQIKTGDDIVGILHENGHLKKDTEGRAIVQSKLELLQDERHRLLLYYNNPIVIDAALKGGFEIPKPEPSFREEQYYLSILYEERRANRNALTEINKMRKEGNDPFPNDPELWRVKKSLTTPLMTYIQHDRDLQKAIGNKANRILDLS